MALKVLKTKFGRWLSSRGNKGEALSGDSMVELMARQSEPAGDQADENSNGQGQVVITKVDPPEKIDRIEKLNEALCCMVDKLDGINTHLEKHVEQNSLLLERIDRLPELVDTLPSSVESQRRIVEALLEQFRGKAIKDEQFAAIIEKIPAETAKQSSILSEMSHKLSVSADADVQMTESFNRFNDTLRRLDENGVKHREGIEQMSRTFAAGEEYLKQEVEKHYKRFFWIFITAAVVCTFAIAGLVTGLILVFNK